MSTFYSRLFSFKKENETTEEFCQKLGISLADIIENDGNDFFLDTIIKIASQLGVSPIWLAFGDNPDNDDY